MNLISRFLRRIRFRRTIKEDQSRNVVEGMVKARRLYKELSVAAHPDKHPDDSEWANDVMSRIVANRHNYIALVELSEEIARHTK